MNIGIVLKDAGGAVLHAVEAPFKAGEEIESLLGTGLKDAPEVKAAVLQLVGKVEAVGVDGVKDVAGDGLNVPSDVQTLNDVVALYSYLKTTFVPLVKSVFGDVKADFEPAPADSPADPASADVSVGPGLHNIVAS